MQETVIVVPCYNEGRRLKEVEFLPLLEREGLGLLFVDDGSVDRTAELLSEIVGRHGPRTQLLRFSVNSGKAEAVRRGMAHALEQGARIVGYMDADASTPADEMLRLLAAMDARGADVVLGARVRLLGVDIRRRPARHYLGRVFATTASLILDLSVYDTQCGAKLFRDTPSLRLALATRFVSRWAFDVELLGRLLMGGAGVPPLPREAFLEIPLRRWRDIDGSKLGPVQMLKSGLELAAIGVELRRGRTRRRTLG